MSGTGRQWAFEHDEIEEAVEAAIARIRSQCSDSADEFARALAKYEAEGLPVQLRGLSFVIKIPNLSQLALQDA